MSTRARKVVLLGGLGYTGRVLSSLLSEQGHSVVSTTRSAKEERPAETQASLVWFDLLDEQSWHNIPSTDWLVWLFPAEPLDSIARISPLIKEGNRRVVVIGTTSSLISTVVYEQVTEEVPLKLALPRVAGEELLRGLGANVLRSAGIYGPGRNPLDWLRRGGIQLGNYVNLIHVEDLASAILAVLESSVSGKQYIVSDGTPRRWADIAAWAAGKKFILKSAAQAVQSHSSRRLSNARLLSEIQPAFHHLDLFKELEGLEMQRPASSLDPQH